MDERLAGLLQMLAEAEAIWYAGTRQDGRPHLAPIWHVWHDNAAWVVTQRGSVRARTLTAARDRGLSQPVALSLPDPMNALILEGMASEAPDAVEAIRPTFQQKYDWDIATDDAYRFIIRVTPTKLMAWGAHGEGRWRFGASGWEVIVRD